MLDRVSPTTRDRVIALVLPLLERKGKTDPIAPEAGLVDAGLTSVDMVALMLAVEAEFDIAIPSADITPGNFRSIATVQAMVDRIATEPA